ncbi:MAG: hypothetical protein WCH99_17660 [Verrucomicrobiota bacterium]
MVGATIARAQVPVYDGMTTLSGVQFPLSNNVVIGQQVHMDPGLLAANPYLTSFSFAYRSDNVGWTTPVYADVKFYLNNGSPFNGFATPSQLIYDSGVFALPNPVQSVFTNGVKLSFAWQDIFLSYNYDNAGGGALTPMNMNVALPSTFTVVYNISGLSGGDTLSLPVYYPPSVGTNYNDYWLKVGINWELVTNNAGGVSFGMQFNNSPTPTPEPSVLGLGALGMVMMAHLIKRRK